MEDEKIQRVTWDGKTAAQYLGISYVLLLDLSKEGEIPCIRAGERYLFRKETLDRWMQEQESSATQKIHKDSKNIGVIRKINV